MDEILIGEKKYVSSKQAAKMTGYAKDYIGQLCREGRVSARLVGRSWYVLETAIKDHRFGEEKTEQEREIEKTAQPAFPQTWEPPRYEASEAETLPTVNRLRGMQTAETVEDNQEEAAQRIQETWQAWFDRFDQAAEVGTSAIKQNDKAEGSSVGQKLPEPELLESETVKVPVHAVRQPSKEEIQSDPVVIESPREESRVGSGEYRKTMRVIQLSGVLVAAVMTLLATLGSGYLDQYILSNSQAGLLAGIELYNK